MMDEFAFIPYQLPRYRPERVPGRVLPPNLGGLHTVQHIKNVMEHLIAIIIVVSSSEFITNPCQASASVCLPYLFFDEYELFVENQLCSVATRSLIWVALSFRLDH